MSINAGVMRMPKLCEVNWFNEDEMYRRIYDVLNTENMLSNPCNIAILPPEPLPPGARPSVYGLCWSLERKIWFRRWPPPYTDFAHELIHLIPNKDEEIEEMYAYNLSGFIIELAKRGIKPLVNPVRLFNANNASVISSVILEAIREVYNYPFKDLADFFMWIGVVPPFLKPRANADGFTLELDPSYDSRTIILTTISEFAAGCVYDELMLKVLLRLFEKMKTVGGLL
jgi:hypothetical protein